MHTKENWFLFFCLAVYILALEMASPGHRHCANCIGALSFPIGYRSTGQTCTDGISDRRTLCRYIHARRLKWAASIVITDCYSNGGVRSHHYCVTPLLRAIGCARRARRLDASTVQGASGTCSPKVPLKLIWAPVQYMVPSAPTSPHSKPIGPHSVYPFVLPGSRSFPMHGPRHSVCSNSPHLALLAVLAIRSNNEFSLAPMSVQ